jgi:hypothetical protein
MSVIARRIGAVPVRTSVQTWQAIAELLARATSPARDELDAVTNVGAMLVAEEYTALAPVVVQPASGARIRIYTVHGEDAIEVQADEQPLSSWPLDQPGWTISFPCGTGDLDDVRTALAEHPAFAVRDVADGIESGEGDRQAATRSPLIIDLEEMSRS